MNQTRPAARLHIGSLIFPRVDQIDFTGPFEVFSRIPNATCVTIAKERGSLRDGRGLILTPEKTFAEVGQLDLLHVAGGPGQEALMDDEETLAFIRRQSRNAKYIFSVCTGALILGAAGSGRRGPGRLPTVDRCSADHCPSHQSQAWNRGQLKIADSRSIGSPSGHPKRRLPARDDERNPCRAAFSTTGRSKSLQVLLTALRM